MKIENTNKSSIIKYIDVRVTNEQFYKLMDEKGFLNESSSHQITYSAQRIGITPIAHIEHLDEKIKTGYRHFWLHMTYNNMWLETEDEIFEINIEELKKEVGKDKRLIRRSSHYKKFLELKDGMAFEGDFIYIYDKERKKWVDFKVFFTNKHIVFSHYLSSMHHLSFDPDGNITIIMPYEDIEHHTDLWAKTPHKIDNIDIPFCEELLMTLNLNNFTINEDGKIVDSKGEITDIDPHKYNSFDSELQKELALTIWSHDNPDEEIIEYYDSNQMRDNWEQSFSIRQLEQK